MNSISLDLLRHADMLDAINEYYIANDLRDIVTDLEPMFRENEEMKRALAKRRSGLESP